MEGIIILKLPFKHEARSKEAQRRGWINLTNLFKRGQSTLKIVLLNLVQPVLVQAEYFFLW